jgi:hypothetical protein
MDSSILMQHITCFIHEFSTLTSETGNTAYYIDEFGIVLPVVGILLSIIGTNAKS